MESDILDMLLDQEMEGSVSPDSQQYPYQYFNNSFDNESDTSYVSSSTSPAMVERWEPGEIVEDHVQTAYQSSPDSSRKKVINPTLAYSVYPVRKATLSQKVI